MKIYTEIYHLSQIHWNIWIAAGAVQPNLKLVARDNYFNYVEGIKVTKWQCHPLISDSLHNLLHFLPRG
jgi:hypothetical protein